MLYCHFIELNYCYNIDFSVDNLQDDDGKNGRIWDGRIWERTKNALARFTQNNCSHEQPIVNL